MSDSECSTYLVPEMARERQPMFLKNKSEMDIIAVLLDATKSDGGVSQASLMCKAELSFAMMREYLRILVDTELIEEKIVEGNQ